MINIVLMVIFATLSPFIILLMVSAPFWLAGFFEKAKRTKDHSPPYCSIDPLEHPAFVWGQDGKGWIQGVDTGKRSIRHD